MSKMKKTTLIWKLVKFVKPLAPVMLVTIVLGILGFLSAIGIAVLSGYGLLIGLGLSNGKLAAIFISLAVCAVLRGLLRYGEQYSGHYIAFRLLALFRDKVFEALRKLAPAKLETRDRGSLVALITADIEMLEVFYAHTIAPVTIAISVSLIMSVFIGSFHPLLGVIAAFSFIFVGYIMPKLASGGAKKLGGEYRGEFAGMMSYFLDAIRGISEIVQFSYGGQAISEIDRQSVSLGKKANALKSHENRIASASDALVILFSLLMFAASVSLYVMGLVDFSGVLIPTIAIFSSFGAVLAVASLSNSLLNTLAAAERVFLLLEEKPIVEETEGKLDHRLTPDIDVSGLCFAYDDNDKAVLKSLDMNIKQGQCIGIVGASGSGKSTLLKLMMRFWDAKTGGIFLGGKNVSEIPTKSLREEQSLLSQETYLFNESIMDNIKIGKANATEDEVAAAAKKAAIHDFIIKLRDGYKTPAGELGSRFSTGEQQRIGLARMFIHNSPVMLLDEPTSNIDILNEKIILSSLRQNSGEKTVVIASHKLSTMAFADSLYHIKDGKIE